MIFEFDCANCGEHVRKYRSPAHPQKTPPRFCSQKCNGAARRGTGIGPVPNYEYYCEWCGVHCLAYRSPSACAPRFCSVQCTGAARRGAHNPSYTGGRFIDFYGYAHLLIPDHPHVDVRGYVLEHRHIMELHISRYLTPDEVVHHINRVKTDNRIENLKLLPSQAEHMRLHAREDRRVRG